jgi:AcrR family transcriptional regulator
VKVTTAGYHHGNLRADLLAAAAEEIRVAGPAALSLRELARRAGVSHAAPAHHFGDKRGLFTALAAEGFRLLYQRTTPELEHPATALARTGQRYVEFALDHPGHFEVMFNSALLDQADEELNRERAIGFAVLYEAVRLATNVKDEAEMVTQALAAWAVVHGVATLWLTGNVPYPPDSKLVERLFADLGPALLPVAQASIDQLDRKSMTRNKSRERKRRNP